MIASRAQVRLCTRAPLTRTTRQTGHLLHLVLLATEALGQLILMRDDRQFPQLASRLPKIPMGDAHPVLHWHLRPLQLIRTGVGHQDLRLPWTRMGDGHQDRQLPWIHTADGLQVLQPQWTHMGGAHPAPQQLTLAPRAPTRLPAHQA